MPSGPQSVGDIVQYTDIDRARDRLYLVTGIYLGAVGQTSVIELMSLSERAAKVDGLTVGPMYVPEPLLRGATVIPAGEGSSVQLPAHVLAHLLERLRQAEGAAGACDCRPPVEGEDGDLIVTLEKTVEDDDGA